MPMLPLDKIQYDKNLLALTNLEKTKHFQQNAMTQQMIWLYYETIEVH